MKTNATNTPAMKLSRSASGRWFAAVLLLAAGLLSVPAVLAQATVCARVKIEIKQTLTLERQAFDAEMRISNTTDTGVIENVAVELKVRDESGSPVPVSDNPNDTSARFFVRVSNKTNIAAIDGSGAVAPMTTGTVNWLLIPAPGSAGATALGKKYLVGATLKYQYGAEQTVLDIAPAVITVKPLPSLTLDYFLPQDVNADDPLTPAIEAAEPFTLGVRVKNNGYATAKALKIDSAQPKIVENLQGLLINFLLTGSYVNDAPVHNTLLANFGDVAGGASKMARWNMETTLAGKFVEYTAKFIHSDELGGALTSILQAANAHALIHDVRVDLPGRDYVRDFLARDGDVVRVYESDGPDTVVSDRSGVATLTAGTTPGGVQYRLSFPPTAGFSYVRLADPFNGSKVPGKVMRSDAKQLSAENVWLSKTRNAGTKQWEYWVNLFDVNSSGEYDSQFQAPPAGPRAPVMQFIPDRVVQESKQVSFLVEASSPDGKALTFAAAPLPVGARLTPQAAAAAGLARAIFDWTPAKGSAGNYPISYSASDGSLSAVRSAAIRVEAAKAPPGPAIPTILSPLSGARLTHRTPVLAVQASGEAGDPTSKVQFELYADEAAIKLLASALLDKGPPGAGAGGVTLSVPTIWQLPDALNNNTAYWWRARAFDGAVFSPWVYARFSVNTFNNVPDQFNLNGPIPLWAVASHTPALAWTNSKDSDGDTIRYAVTVYRDAALSTVLAQSADLPGDASGSTSWTVPVPLADAPNYYWRALAKDALGGQTQAAARTFTVKTTSPEAPLPLPLSPAAGSRGTSPTTALVAGRRTEQEALPDGYVFEIDTVSTFDSGNKRISGLVKPSGAAGASWSATNLVEDQHYWWRVKARRGPIESAWAGSHFLMSAANHAPPAPTVKNPGNAAWTASLHPSLEANPVADPEGDAVRYQFEVYKDAALGQKFADGSSANSALVLPAPLVDGAAYWWRVRALDASGAASSWSAASMLYVRSAPSQGLAIAVTSPVALVVPQLSDGRRQVTIRWEGADPNSTATVALYFSASANGFGGTRIVDGLPPQGGAQSGGYVWDAAALAPGVYYVYAEIYDGSGVGRAYAPGAVVIPNAQPGGTLGISGPGTWYEAAAATVAVSWSGASESAMLLPISGNAAPTSPDALAVSGASGIRLVALSLPYQCNKEPLSITTRIGAVLTEDLNFAGRVASTGAGKVVYAPSNTGDESLRVCDIRIVAERKLDAAYSEFTVSAKLSNLGAAIAVANAAPLANAPGVSVFGALEFNAIGAGELANSRTTVTVRAPSGASGASSILQKGLTWSVLVVR
jgi:hypothetical protein